MKRNFLFVAAVFISSQICAQEDSTKNLDELIVTATKTPIKQSSTGKVVTVINQETLQQNIGKTLTDILNYQAGVYVNGANNTLGTNQDNYLRGAASGYTLILVDGIPVGDPSQINNSFDLNNINPAQVERIEILKGAQSTLWGSDAVAGVINIITKKGGPGKLVPTANISYGSYNTVRAGVGLGGQVDKFTYNVAYNYTGSKGFSAAHDSTGILGFDKDGFKQHNVQANLAYAFTPKFTLSAMANYGRYKADLDAGAFADDKDYTGTNTDLISSLSLVYKTAGVTLHFTNTLNNAKRTLNDDSTSVGGFVKFSNGMYKGNSFISELYGNFALGGHWSLVGGVQRLGQNTAQSYLSISDFGPYQTSLGKDSAKTTNYAAYASLLFLNENGFNAEAGVRYNNHSIYGSNATYTFNPSYNIGKVARVFVNISSAYKIPSLYQLYSEYGNKSLKPEQSNNYELGAQFFLQDKKTSIRLVGFKRDIRQLIVFYTDAVTYASQYINRDKQNDYGIELETNFTLGKFGNWVSNATYVDGRGKSGDEKVKNFYRRPNFVLNSLFNLKPVKSLTVTPALRVVGSRLKALYDAGPDKMPAYYTVDLYAAYNFTSRLRLFADFRNITNQEYFDIVGYNSRRFNWVAGLSLLL